jgi:hypothetical protein
MEEADLRAQIGFQSECLAGGPDRQSASLAPVAKGVP